MAQHRKPWAPGSAGRMVVLPSQNRVSPSHSLTTALTGFLCLGSMFLGLVKSAAAAPTVIAYCAQDQVYAEPIFRQFEKQTGIKLRAVYDNEAVKTVGLANRLLAERRHPVCDVFWGNEEL